MALENMTMEELMDMARGIILMGKTIPDELVEYLSNRWMDAQGKTWNGNAKLSETPHLSVSQNGHVPHAPKAFVKCYAL